MIIRGIDVDIDVVEELEPFQLDKAKINGDEIQACSPYRDERKPSFYINIYTGLWKDFGAENSDLGQGNFIQLMSFLHQLDYKETEEYLLDKYNIQYDDYEEMPLNINLQRITEVEPKVFTKQDLAPYLHRNVQYLLKRGIPEDIQEKFYVLYDKEQKAVAFLWRDAFTGEVATIKFRSVLSKKFYYKRGGQPVSQHIYGLYNAIKYNVKKVYIVESEIDAMYLWGYGIPAIALGGSSISDRQEWLITVSGIETIVIATDADKAGNKLKEILIWRFGGKLEVRTVQFPEYANDVNDITPEDIEKVTDSETPVTLEVML